MSTKTMDNLEALSNDQLRVRLLEYGFANLPVTATTRKVLIKKLRNHIDGEKSKIRRETIHVAKYSSDEESEDGKGKVTVKESNRRATIGVPSISKDPAPIKATTTRRSGRVTPSVVNNSTSVAPKVLDITEDTDEDEIVIKPINTRRSKSKTPISLSKTEPVTISIKHIKPVLENVVEDDYESNSEIYTSPRISPPKPRNISPMKTYSGNDYSSTTTTSSVTRKRTTIGGGAESGITSPFGGTSGTGVSSTSEYNSSNLSNMNSYPSKTLPRQSISTSYNTLYSSGLPSQRYGNSEFVYSGYTSPYTKPTITSPSLYPVLPKNYGEEEDEEEENDEENDGGTEIGTNQYKSRYLSQFTRRLSELRAEPLGISKESEAAKLYTSPNLISSGKPYQRTNITTRKPISVTRSNDSILQSLKIFWNQLNHKYSINLYLMLFFVILFIIFVVVMVFF